MAFEVNAISVNFTKESGMNEVDTGSAIISEDEALLENDTKIYDGNIDYEDVVILFEGDIEISLATLRKYYEINETIEKELILMRIGSNEHHMSKRAATSDEDRLWTSKVVPYVISSALSTERDIIMNAMETWSEATCIRFVPRQSQRDYIHFVQGDWCSSVVGRDGGRQYIRLHDDCSSHRTVLHEIGHALGLWHEHARPDRDSYVTYHEENVIEEESSNFMKKKDKEVDYQGTEYDYGSVMHYHKTAFVRPGCTGCESLTINNNAEYERQGRPRLGSEDRLSSTDIIQVKRLYRCSGRGQHGLLVLEIRNGINLEDTDTGLLEGNPDPYVEVKAITSNGDRYIKKTSHKQGTRNPTWNEKLVFSINEWQFFRIRVWDSDYLDDDDSMGMSVTFPLQRASFTTRSRRYCANTGCNRYILYNYQLLPTFTGTLRVKVRYARNLPDTDIIFNNPDPYVVVEAFKSDGSLASARTSTRKGTTDPSWNTVLSMDGCEFARQIKVQVFDDDVLFDDEMSTAEYINLRQDSQSDVRHCVTGGCSGYLILDTEIIPNRCERSLKVTVKYGRNIPDRDRLWGSGESDPYVRVKAYRYRGRTNVKKTSTRSNDEDPDWNVTLYFGRDIWTKFVVSVWDEDVGFDDRLSSDNRVNLPTTGSRSGSFTVYTNGGGYVKLSYSYQ